MQTRPRGGNWNALKMIINLSLKSKRRIKLFLFRRAGGGSSWTRLCRRFLRGASVCFLCLWSTLWACVYKFSLRKKGCFELQTFMYFLILFLLFPVPLMFLFSFLLWFLCNLLLSFLISSSVFSLFFLFYFFCFPIALLFPLSFPVSFPIFISLPGLSSSYTFLFLLWS